ncbi:glycine--tRNA ligase subunit beta, partial [Candidatus Xenohaliotis californiensis]|uniref:glycine--tRNA ligase subunit beta n=1 Tax=Candidatus Xenohaliotis californiensis TaxID=84677 RepID=UPI0030C87508
MRATVSIDLIFECLSEEILIDEQLNAVDQLTKNIKGLLKKQQIQHNEIIGFCTPRRLVLIVHKIITNNSEESYIKGPSTDASSISIIGFAKKHNTTPEALLTFSIRDKKFYGIARKSLAITHTITNILTNTLQTIKWQKNMHWGTHELKWARPIHNIMYVLSNEKAKLTLGHIESNNTTYTGRFIKNSEKKEINSIDEYIKCMLDNNIILDQNERVRIFRDKIKEIAAEYHMKISQDLKDASAVALATEMPHAMLVEINQTLVASLPEEIIVSVLETYSFLPMWQEDGSLSSKTITAINIPPTTIIVDGYRKMLESRLMDAMHIWQQSIIQDPKLLYNRLQRISFYESLGDMAEKTTRITALAKYLAIWIPHAQIDQVEKAANIAKLDLTMSITKEFPKLQG